ncbi:MAG: Crp/Fnr family transcriptional regulator [Aureispira sp.]
MEDRFTTYLRQFSPLPKDLARELVQVFKRRTLKKDAYFARAGSYVHDIGFLEEGVVRAYAKNEAGKVYNKQFFVGPTLIGAYSALILQQPNQIAQQALTDCIIHQAPYKKITALYEEHHCLEHLGRQIAERLFIEKEKKELERAFLDATARYLLLREEYPTLEQQIPQYHIAAYLGISATQLSRIRHQLTLS